MVAKHTDCGFPKYGAAGLFWAYGGGYERILEKNVRLLVSYLYFHPIIGVVKSSRRRMEECVRREGEQCIQGIDWET